MAMLWVRHHYRQVAREVSSVSPLRVEDVEPPLVFVTVQNWGKIVQRALQFALTLSPDIRAVHVTTEEEAEPLREEWSKYVEEPVKRAGRRPPQLVVLPSPYRLVLRPILDYVLRAEKEHPDRQIAIIVPELVERHWYHYPLHNQRAEILKALILLHGSDRIVLINVPWYLKA